MVVIAISGMPGAGSSTIGELLAKKLKLAFFSVGSYNKDEAKKYIKNEKETKRAVEFWKQDEKFLNSFHKKTDEMQIERAKKGNVVIEGKLAIHFLKDIADYKIWLWAPMMIRAERIQMRDKIPFEEALKNLEEKEQLERENWNKMYGFDYFSQREYADLVIDTSDKTTEEIVDFIIKKFKLKQSQHLQKGL